MIIINEFIKTVPYYLYICIIFIKYIKHKDIQLIYFLTFDPTSLKINEKIRRFIGIIALNNIPPSTFGNY